MYFSTLWLVFAFFKRPIIMKTAMVRLQSTTNKICLVISISNSAQIISIITTILKMCEKIAGILVAYLMRLL